MSTFVESSNKAPIANNSGLSTNPHASQFSDVVEPNHHTTHETTSSIEATPSDNYKNHLADAAAAARRREFNDSAVRDRRRVYIGNLHHKVLVNELKDCFKDYRVTNVIIKKIKDGLRPNGAPFIKNSGYAFMDFDTPQECERAMKQAEGREIRGRKIYIKLAVPDELRKRCGRSEQDEQNESARSTQPRSEPRTRLPPPHRSEPRLESKPEPRLESKSGIKSETPQSETRSTSVTADSKLSTTDSNGVIVVPSSTFDLYISNLPRNTTSRNIREFFDAYNPVWVQIKKREVFSEAQQKSMLVSRGFAFVGFSEAAMRDKAVQDLNGVEMGDRIVHVTVAREKVYTSGRSQQGVSERNLRDRPPPAHE
ncbi:hypothetical protein NADFUDRAFT_84589 [Nadsonia fulvescens var. elongata DSM 6958]|uniref:RRM domain-containing protein n=1 Tax=Nadsonia fulvescens var. elongata DSM 6958 TaxID=857566 RepID=A0A1E3PDT1_9ASCO|nr:hypothetical protein NADFUDRAFT_84589 [Nadsonia fulvescens var. elongata DSM 6958]